MTAFSRRRFLAAAVATGVTASAGCSSPGSSADGGDGADAGQGGDGGDGGPSTSDTVGTGGTEGASETDPPTPTDPAADPTQHLPTTDETLPLPMSPSELRSEARSGGPAKDGIPSIDDPSFISAEEQNFLQLGDPVFGVVRGDTVKAYPQKILVHHEIVNDRLDGEPVAVTYCPLTGTVQGFDRGDTTFGVSGRLINNNLVMYDRATEAWWPQILATAIPGPWNEGPPTVSLSEFRLVWTTWKEWRDQYPDTQVLSKDTGSARNYRRDPYGAYNPRTGYYKNANTLFPSLNKDTSHQAKKVFMGARTPEGAVAFGKTELTDAGIMTGQIGATTVLAVADPRFTTGYVYLNPEERSFEYDDGEVLGDGETFAPDALPLTRVHTFDAMWFAWSGYYPDSNIYA